MVLSVRVERSRGGRGLRTGGLRTGGLRTGACGRSVAGIKEGP